MYKSCIDRGGKICNLLRIKAFSTPGVPIPPSPPLKKPKLTQKRVGFLMAMQFARQIAGVFAAQKYRKIHSSVFLLANPRIGRGSKTSHGSVFVSLPKACHCERSEAIPNLLLIHVLRRARGSCAPISSRLVFPPNFFKANPRIGRGSKSSYT